MTTSQRPALEQLATCKAFWFVIVASVIVCGIIIGGIFREKIKDPAFVDLIRTAKSDHDSITDTVNRSEVNILKMAADVNEIKVQVRQLNEQVTEITESIKDINTGKNK
jgi:peptidoglycan hydrolase CwlO-like protein